jgi:hypothetical protein
MQPARAKPLNEPEPIEEERLLLLCSGKQQVSRRIISIDDCDGSPPRAPIKS